MSNASPNVGSGVNLFVTDDISGTARWFEDTSDVLSIDDDDLAETIAFVHKGGMTFLSPILPDLKAIVCTAGSRESHLAILCRESGIPCLLATELTGTISSGDNITLRLTDPDTGTIVTDSAARAGAGS